MNKSLKVLLFVSLLGTYACKKDDRGYKSPVKAKDTSEATTDEEPAIEPVTSIKDVAKAEFVNLVSEGGQYALSESIKADLTDALVSESEDEINEYAQEIMEIRMQEEIAKIAKRHNPKITDVQISMFSNTNGLNNIKLKGYKTSSSDESSLCVEAEDGNLETSSLTDFAEMMAEIVAGEVVHDTGSEQEQEEHAKMVKEKSDAKVKLVTKLTKIALSKSNLLDIHRAERTKYSARFSQDPIVLEEGVDKDQVIEADVHATTQRAIVNLSNAFNGDLSAISFKMRNSDVRGRMTVFSDMTVTTTDGETTQVLIKKAMQTRYSVNYIDKDTAYKSELANYLAKIIATPRN